MIPEFPNFIGILSKFFPKNEFFKFLFEWENIVFSLIVIAIIVLFAWLGVRKMKIIPDRRQSFFESLAEGLDEFLKSLLGGSSRKYLPFLGTLFIYILLMNLIGLIPFMKSPTASLSTTFALAIIVFIYVQFTAIKELGLWGYLDHLAGRPRGVMAMIVVFPIFMLILHLITELIRPISLSMRLRGNIWGDDILLAVLAGFGAAGFPLLLVNMVIAVLTAVIQALVFCLLSAIYFALVLKQEHN